MRDDYSSADSFSRQISAIYSIAVHYAPNTNVITLQRCTGDALWTSESVERKKNFVGTKGRELELVLMRARFLPARQIKLRQGDMPRSWLIELRKAEIRLAAESASSDSGSILRLPSFFIHIWPAHDALLTRSRSAPRARLSRRGIGDADGEEIGGRQNCSRWRIC